MKKFIVILLTLLSVSFVVPEEGDVYPYLPEMVKMRDQETIKEANRLRSLMDRVVFYQDELKTYVAFDVKNNMLYVKTDEYTTKSPIKVNDRGYIIVYDEKNHELVMIVDLAIRKGKPCLYLEFPNIGISETGAIPTCPLEIDISFLEPSK